MTGHSHYLPPPPLLCVQMTTFFPHSTSSCNITLYRCCCIGCIVGIIIIIINPLTARVVGAPQMILQSVFSIFPVLHCPLGLAELQACPFPDVVFPPLPLSALSSSPFHHALQDGFGQTWWTGNMTIPLQFESPYDRREIFMRSNCLLGLGTDFLVGNMRCVVSCGSTSFQWLVFFFGALL